MPEDSTFQLIRVFIYTILKHHGKLKRVENLHAYALISQEKNAYRKNPRAFTLLLPYDFRKEISDANILRKIRGVKSRAL
jgi:hypothetical protein